MNPTSTTSRPRYVMLDSLRGFAALVVLVFHVFEGLMAGRGDAHQHLYHGFLGVDFFFILSGFVMGYAYDARWSQMSFLSFVRRRVIRLQPMVVAGATLGLVVYVAQGCVTWEGVHRDALTVALAFVASLTLFPFLWTDHNLRGFDEIYPLNGPHWSMFFEYLGSWAYALWLRRVSTRWLWTWVVVTGLSLGIYNGWMGNINQGWGADGLNLLGGLLRVGFGYPAGLLLARLFPHGKPEAHQGRHPLRWAALLVALLCVPSLSLLTGIEWLNPLYEWLCVVICFPLLVWKTAQCDVQGTMERVASYVGRLSYPLYAIHYPLIYLYIGWLQRDYHPFGAPWITPVVLAFTAILLGVLCLHFYDEPLRRCLSRFVR